jgi:hypothetical protein
MNTKTNRAEVTADDETDDFPLTRCASCPAVRELVANGRVLSPASFPTGHERHDRAGGKYQKGRGSVDEFLELTAIANPHAEIVFVPHAHDRGRGRRCSRAEEEGQVSRRLQDRRRGWPWLAQRASAFRKPRRTTEDMGPGRLPARGQRTPARDAGNPAAPQGVELGILLQMLKDYEAAEKGGTLYGSFRRSSAACRRDGERVLLQDRRDERTKVSDIDPPQAESCTRSSRTPSCRRRRRTAWRRSACSSCSRACSRA